MQYVKVSASSCVLQFTRPSIAGLLDTVGVLQRESFASSGQWIEPRYIVNLCFIFVRDKKLPTEWIFFERVLSATSYTITSNPQSHFSRVLSFNEKGLKTSIKDNMDFEDINSFTQHSLQESFRPLAEVLYSRPYLIFAYHGDFIKYRSSFRDGLLLIGVW